MANLLSILDSCSKILVALLFGAIGYFLVIKRNKSQVVFDALAIFTILFFGFFKFVLKISFGFPLDGTITLFIIAAIAFLFGTALGERKQRKRRKKRFFDKQKNRV